MEAMCDVVLLIRQMYEIERFDVSLKILQSLKTRKSCRGNTIKCVWELQPTVYYYDEGTPTKVSSWGDKKTLGLKSRKR